jgi:hypothetical protein
MGDSVRKAVCIPSFKIHFNSYNKRGLDDTTTITYREYLSEVLPKTPQLTVEWELEPILESSFVPEGILEDWMNVIIEQLIESWSLSYECCAEFSSSAAAPFYSHDISK